MLYTDDIQATFEKHMPAYSFSVTSPCPITPKKRYEAIFEHVLLKTALLEPDTRAVLKDANPDAITQDIHSDIIEACSNFTIYYTIDELIRHSFADPNVLSKDELSDVYVDLFNAAANTPSPDALILKLIDNAYADYIEDANAFLVYY